MKTQQDTSVRMVALENLRAMCARVSGMCHRYWIESVSKSRVVVGYSNPDEYGSECPIYASFPHYPSGFHDDAGNPRVVLDPVRVHGGRQIDRDCGDMWQSFEPLTGCPVLWRDPETFTWKTREEIEAKKAG